MKTIHINFPSDCFTSVTKNHKNSHGPPCNINGLLQIFKVFNNLSIFSWSVSQQHPHINQPKTHTWEGFLADFKTFKLFVILLINHPNQSLNKISAPMNTLCNGTFVPLLETKIQTFFLKKNYFPFWEKPKPHYLSTLLFIFLLFHHEIFVECTSCSSSFVT